MLEKKQLRKDLKTIQKVYLGKYGYKEGKSGSLEINLKWPADKVFCGIEEIVRAVEICTLKYVLEVGGGLNTGKFYPYWRFSSNKLWQQKMYRAQAKKMQQGVIREMINANFKTKVIKGKTYYLLKKGELRSSFIKPTKFKVVDNNVELARKK